MDYEIFIVNSVLQIDKKSILENRKFKPVRITHIPLIPWFFKWATFLGVIPYKISFDQNENIWKAEITRTRLLFCTIATWIPTIVHIIIHCTNCAVLIAGNEHASAKTYMGVANGFVFAIRHLMFVFLIARHKHKFINVLNTWSRLYSSILDASNQNNKTETELIRTTRRFKAYFLTIIIILTSALGVFTVFSNNYNTRLENPTDALYGRIVTARKFFHLDPVEPKEIISFGNVCLAVLLTWLRGAEFKVTLVIELFLNGVYPLTLWFGTTYFVKATTEKDSGKISNSYINILSIVAKYNLLKEYSDCLSQLAGMSYLLWILNFCFRALFKHQIQSQTKNVGSYITMVFLAMLWIYGIASLVISAETFKAVKMGNVKYWLILQKRRTKILENQAEELEGMLVELQEAPVGILRRGVFQCNYGFLAQLAAVLITIFTISFETGIGVPT